MNRRQINTYRYRPSRPTRYHVPTPEEIEVARREKERQKADLADWISRGGKEAVGR